MRIAVYGLWHLGCVVSACLAEVGHEVTGLDGDAATVKDLNAGRPPLYEPGLAELIQAGQVAGRLRFTADPAEAFGNAEVLIIAFDTPVNERDEADVGYVRHRLESIESHLPAGLHVLVTAQVPVGFTRALALRWRERSIRCAYSPENLRLGKALDAFRKAERVVVGVQEREDELLWESLFRPFTPRIEWMSIESAEMTKHALNAFLATSVTFINEVARLCEAVGANAKEVERGLKSEGRIGPRAYLGPGAAFAGGTLARDLRFLTAFGSQHSIVTPLLSGALESNERHKFWLRDTISRTLAGREHPVVATLGLTYKPGTDTLRRSVAVETCHWLHAQGIGIRAFDPAVKQLPKELQAIINLAPTLGKALAGADLAIVATEWPEFKTLNADEVVTRMRHAIVIDPNWFLAQALATDPRVAYFATGAAGIQTRS